MPGRSTQISIRLSSEAFGLLLKLKALLSKEFGISISRAKVLEVSLKELARKRGIQKQ